MRYLILFATLCFASVHGDTDGYRKDHSSNKYLSGSSNQKYLGNFLNSRRSRGGMFDNNRMNSGMSLFDNYNDYNDYNSRYSSRNIYDNLDNYRHNNRYIYDNLDNYRRNNRYIYDNLDNYRRNNRYIYDNLDNYRNRRNMYDGLHNYRYNNRNYDPYTNRYDSRYYSRRNSHFRHNDYNRAYDSHSGGYPVFGSQPSVF